MYKKKILAIIVLIALIILGVFLMYFYRTSNSKKEVEVIVEPLDNSKDIISENKNIWPYIDCNLDNYHNGVDKICKANNVYGMQIVVFKGEEIIDSYNYGYSDIYRKEEVNDDTVFRIASTSKMISNMLIMKLVDEGKLSLDSNLKELTGLDFDDDVKLYHILTHTSGLIDSSAFNNNLNTIYDINYLLRISNVRKPGTTYNYTNFGAGTMAAIIESVTGRYFMDYAKEELFDVMGLNAGYVCEHLKPDTVVAKMYDDEVINPLTWKYNEEFYKKFELGKQYRMAYGNLFISGKDLAKLGMVLAGNGKYKDDLILSYNSLNEIRTIRNEALGYTYKTGLNTDFFDDYVEGRRLYGHTGSAYGAISCLIYDPSDNTGVALVTNHAVNVHNDKDICCLLYDSVNLVYSNFFTYK